MAGVIFRSRGDFDRMGAAVRKVEEAYLSRQSAATQSGPQRAGGVFVRVTSATPDADGYYPAVYVQWNLEAAAWYTVVSSDAAADAYQCAAVDVGGDALGADAVYAGTVVGMVTSDDPDAPADSEGLFLVVVQAGGGDSASAWKEPVRAATTVALPSGTYANGSSGVGATLTGSSNGALAAQDGVTLVVNDRLLVKDEATTSHNGIYALTTVGDGSHPYVLTRATDADTGAELLGATVVVTEGTTNADTVWLGEADATITVGTTSLPWVKISSDLTVEEDDGSPSFPHIDKVQFNHLDGFVVSQPATGKALVSLPLLRTLTCFDFLADFDATATCNEDGTITLNITKYFKSASGYGIVISDTPCP